MIDVDELEDVKGLKTSDVLDLSVEELGQIYDKSPTLARQVIQVPARTANKRKQRKIEAGFYKPYKSVDEDFSTRGKNKKELFQTFRNLKTLFGFKTSTLRGARKRDEQLQELFDSIKDEKTDLDKETFFKMYDKLFNDNILYEKYKYDVWLAVKEVLEENPYFDVEDPEQMEMLKKRAKDEIYGIIDEIDKEEGVENDSIDNAIGFRK